MVTDWNMVTDHWVSETDLSTPICLIQFSEYRDYFVIFH